MKKNSTFSLPAVGLSSLLVIFAVLCLTVFSLLSVSTVNAHRHLAENSRNAVSAYYQADCEAEQILAELRSGRIPTNVQQENNQYIYSCVISDTQMLTVCVEVTDDDYTILRWQAVSTADWEANDKLPVWDGEKP